MKFRKSFVDTICKLHSNSMIIATFSGVRMIHDPTFGNSVRKYVSSFCRTLKNLLPLYKDVVNICDCNKIILGRDGRDISEQYVTHVAQCLSDAGFSTEYLDIVPTPTVQQIVQLHGAAGGIVITASHNSAEWCGLKFIGPSSIFFTPQECSQMFEDLRDEGVYSQSMLTENVPNFKNVGSEQALREHINHVLGSDLILVEKIRKANLHIAFSGCNASGAVYIPILAEMLNLHVLTYQCDQIGKLPTKPEPTPANLQEFSNFIKRQKQHIDVGFAVDPDADRCVLMDENASVMNEELTLALCAQYVLKTDAQQWFVKNCSTSLICDDICQEHGTTIVETAVGEVNVALKMKEIGARIGGEGNGGVLLRDAHLGRDSIVAICLILSSIVSNQLFDQNLFAISKVAAALPQYVIQKEKYNFKLEDKASILIKIEAMTSKASNHPDKFKVISVDGVKLLYEEKRKWVHVRFSNTEPIVRIIAEAKTVAECMDLISKIEKSVFV